MSDHLPDPDVLARHAVAASADAPDAPSLTVAEREQLLDTLASSDHRMTSRPALWWTGVATAAAVVLAIVAGYAVGDRDVANNRPLADDEWTPTVPEVEPDLPSLTMIAAREQFAASGNDRAFAATLGVESAATLATAFADGGARTARDEYRYGMLLARTGDQTAALAAFNRAFANLDETDPIHAHLLVASGEAQLELGEPESALVSLTVAIDRLPDDADARVQLGRAHLALGQVADAAMDFSRAIELDPGNADAYRLRADARQRRGDAAGARADRERADAVPVSHAEHGFVEIGLPEFDIEVDGKRYPATVGAWIPATPRAADTDAYPVMIYLHGGGGDAFNKQGSASVRNGWSTVAEKKGYVCVGPNSQRRGWGRPSRDHYVRMIIAAVKKLAEDHPLDLDRVLISGGSAGSDFIYTSGVQLALKEAGIGLRGCLPLVPGPPHMVGTRRGELAKVSGFPFLHVCGRKDTIRKDGSWVAHQYLLERGGISEFIEMPDRGHEFPSSAQLESYIDWFEQLEERATETPATKLDRAIAAETDGRLHTAARLARIVSALELPTDDLKAKADALLARLAARATAAWASASTVNESDDPGRAAESAWQCMILFAGFPEGDAAAERYRALSKQREVMRAHSRWVDQHRWTPPAADELPEDKNEDF